MNNVWKEFDFMWGIAPPGSLKFKKAQVIVAFIRKNFIERAKVEEIIGEDEKLVLKDGLTKEMIQFETTKNALRNELRAEQRKKLSV